MADSKSKTTAQKNIRKGLATYKTGQSIYWFLRLWDPLAKKYVRRTTKETVRIEAIEAAIEFADNYKSGGHPVHAVKKATSFERYAKQLISIQALKGGKWSGGDAKLLNRSDDGLIGYFGKWDVTKINTGSVRDYLLKLDENRGKPLAESTKAKHTIILRKVLTLAVKDGVLNVLPAMPSFSRVAIMSRLIPLGLFPAARSRSADLSVTDDPSQALVRNTFSNRSQSKEGVVFCHIG